MADLSSIMTGFIINPQPLPADPEDLPPVPPDPLAALKKAHARAERQLETAAAERIRAEESLRELDANTESSAGAPSSSSKRRRESDLGGFSKSDEALIAHTKQCRGLMHVALHQPARYAIAKPIKTALLLNHYAVSSVMDV
eukprot:scaffold225082_cov17-Prasinocladus_malaysianus.AAC.1